MVHRRLTVLAVLACAHLCRCIARYNEVTPLPFTALQQGRFIWAFNQFRSRLQSGNMQCVTRWNPELAESAQKISEACSLTIDLNEDYGVTMTVRQSMHDMPTAAEIVEQMYTEGQGHYSYEDNSCDSDIRACNNFKQFAWHKVREVGCGLSRCDIIEGYADGGYLAVCAMDSKAKLRQPPFAPGPQCSSCSRLNPTCTNGLCCPLDWQSAPIRRCTARPSEENLIPLHRFYNAGTATNLLISDEKQVAFLRQQGMPYKGIIGRISRQQDKTCPHLQPVHHVYSETFSGDYYTIDNLIYNGRINREIQDFGTLGYAVPGSGICEATVPVYEFYHRLGIIQVINSTEMEQLFREDRSGFSYRGISFSIWP